MILTKNPYKLLTIVSLSCVSIMANGQDKKQGSITNEDIVIDKERKIELPQANRIFEKIPTIQDANKGRGLRYEFTERKLPIQMPQFSPVVVMPGDGISKENTKLGNYNNVIKAGFGNYAHTFLEGHVGIQPNEDVYHGIYFKHDGNRLGPVGASNSGRSQNLIKVHSKTITNTFKFDGAIGWERQSTHFYGKVPNPYDIVADSIAQHWNKFHYIGSISNAIRGSKIDYTATSGLSFLYTKYDAREWVWDSKINAVFPITNGLTAHFDGNMVISEYTDEVADRRQLFKLKPTFQYKNDFLNISAGINIANDKDKNLNLNDTYVFPTAKIDVQPIENIHVFGGIDGDVYMNNFMNILQEMPWLAAKSQLKDTRKTAEFFAGAKGLLENGFGFEAKVSYGQYRNFYVFNNSGADSTRFNINFSNDTTKVKVTNFSGQLNYQYENFRSLLKVDYYNYAGLGNLDQAWHRPSFTATWNNTLTFKEKLIVSSDIYFITGLKGKNLITNKEQNLSSIFDLNLKFTYLITDRFNVFVSANNILGKEYQRYLYYPQQGINFLAGLSYSF